MIKSEVNKNKSLKRIQKEVRIICLSIALEMFENMFFFWQKGVVYLFAPLSNRSFWSFRKSVILDTFLAFGGLKKAFKTRWKILNEHNVAVDTCCCSSVGQVVTFDLHEFDTLKLDHCLYFVMICAFFSKYWVF